MIWRLTYCNKKGVEARVDIIKGDRTSVEIVEGSGQPFTLSYKLDKNDKSGHIMTSSADIEFFETEEFNIDKLKTSNETELKVEYFEANVLTWSGFILPDFFSREIGSPNIVRMTASDRLTALKGVTLSDLPAKVSLRDLIELSLSQTGLTLSLASQIQINQGSTNILDSEILSQRLTDVRGRSVNCYDILMSIMVGTNSTIRQRAGQWQVYNKLEHELRTPTIFFDKVERGAIRTIQPVASSVGIYNEFGGGKPYPDNYDFSDGLTGWTAEGGFVASTNDKEVLGYYETYNLRYGTEIVPRYFVNTSPYSTTSFLRTDSIPSPYTSGEVEVSATVNAVGPYVNGTKGRLRIAIVAIKDGITLYLKDGSFSSATPYIHEYLFEEWSPTGMVTLNVKISGKIQNPSGYVFQLRMYGSMIGQLTRVTTADFAQLEFKSTSEVPKGNLYKTTQGSNFTKQHDIETIIFGDYIRKGLNGYFYDYPIDDTSNLYLPNGTLSPPQWITAFDTTERPLLHHISRQKSRLFSVAHDILRANINVESFDPLAVFQDCKDRKYIVVSASFDFLRSEVDVELEQIAYDNTILKRDFIYSYFGEGESNIKSIGGIAGGGGGTGGGGMTSEQLEMLTNLADWWKLDEDNDAIYSEKSIYSLNGVSALGLGNGGGSGGGVDMLDDWANYTTVKANYYVPASLLVPFRNDTLGRLTSLESGSATSIVTTGSGNAITSLTKSGNVITATKGLSFALASHTHTIAQITGLQGALDLKATQSDIDTAIDGVEIGGRNLILQSDIRNWEGVTFGEDENGTYARTHIRDLVGDVFPSVEYEENTQYTFSGGYKKDSGNANGLSFVYSDGSRATIFRAYSDDFETFSYTSEKGKTISSVERAWSTGGDTRYYNLKLEKGNKATDWTPAPEDQITDWSETDVNSFAFLKNKPTQLSQFTDNIGVATHIANKANPHAVTTAQIGAVNLTTNQTIGGVKTFTGNVTAPTFIGALSVPPTEGTLGIRTLSLGGGGVLWQFRPSATEAIRTGIGFGWYNTEWVIGNIRGGGADSYGFGIGYRSDSTNKITGAFRIATNGTAYLNNVQIATRSTTLAGYGITDGVTLNTAQTITGAKTFSSLLTASAGTKTPKVDFGNGFTIEPSGTELVFKYNGVIKQRMLSDGTILATGGLTALTTN